MGQEQKSKNTYRSNYKRDEEEEDNGETKETKRTKEKNNEIEEEKIDICSLDSQQIFDKLNNMDMSLCEIKANFYYYQVNFLKLMKINKIIQNIKNASLYELFTPKSE